MKKPQAIIFDYGHTLCYESYFDLQKGGYALYENIVSNPNCIDRDEFVHFSIKVYNDMALARRELGLELPASSYMRLLREYFEIEFALPEIELSELYWDSISPPSAMDGAIDLFDFLKAHGIKTAVISNLWYASEVLSRRINRLIPNNNINFFMSTCDYGFRKPNRLLYEIVTKKLGVQPNQAWFCGDEPNADILGAHNAGLVPIWFNPNIVCPYKFKPQSAPTVDHIQITKLSEIADMLTEASDIFV